MMRIIVIFIFVICSFVRFSYAQDTTRPKIALVLSGGGAKGFAHIGVLKVLEKEKIPIDIIIGTSFGSIVGGLYSIGYSAEEIENMAKTENWDRLLTDDISRMQLSPNAKIEKQRFIGSIPVNNKYKPIVPQGVINGQNILNVFCRLTGNVPENADFSKFPISFACIGTDLETGKEIVIDHGFLPTAIFSSMTIPGVFMPIEHNNEYMLDGGLVNNFPTDVAKKMGADIIIGVDIRNDLYQIKDINTIEHLMDQVINFYAIGKDSVNNSLCKILIKPDINGFNVYSFTTKAVDTLIKRGVVAAQQKKDEIRKLKSDYHLSAPKYSKKLTSSDFWKIDHITISGNYSMNNKFIRNNLDLDVPQIFTSQQIQDGIDRLYGLGCFKRVYYKLIPDENGSKTLDIILDEQPYKNINVGMRVNTTDAVSILLNFTQKDYRRFIGLVSVTADISSNPGLNIQTELSKGNFPVFGLQLEGKYGKYNIFLEQRKAYSTEIYYGIAKAYTYKNVKNSSLLGIGIKEEVYKGNIYNSLVDSAANLLSNQTSITSLYTYLSVDNLDDYYFPTRGIKLYAEFLLSTDEYYQNISPIALIKNRNVFQLPGNNNFLLNFYGRALFSQNVHQFQQTYVGGTDYSTYFSYHIPFYGLPPVTPTNMYTFIGQTGVRINIIRNHYISLMGDVLFDKNELYPFINYHTTLGAALSYSVKSILGPLDFTVGYSDTYRKITLSANAGYWF